MNCKRCDAKMKPTILYQFPAKDNRLAVQAGYECLKCGICYADDKWVDMRAEPTDDDDTDPHGDSYGGHVGFWLGVGEGEEPIHVLGDPKMSDETAKALAEIAKAARRAIDRGEL